MNELTGLLFDISRFAVHDGPGIRTTVFLKGCPLHCPWCHNPEGIAPRPQLLFRPESCIGCGRCAAACAAGLHTHNGALSPEAAARCTACGACAAACPSEALSLCGRRVTVEEVVEEAARDRSFYGTSGGGVTLSGGEPLAQPRFTRALLAALKRTGLHTCVETAAVAPEAVFAEIVADTDLFLIDCKHTDPDILRTLTGADDAVIQANLHLLDQQGKPVILRCPIIPGVNDTPTHLAGIAARANRYANIRQIELMPYHAYGCAKRAQIVGGAPAGDTYRPPTQAELDGWLTYIRARTDTPVAGELA